MRPQGLTALTLLMCVMNPAGLIFVEGEGTSTASLAIVSAIIALSYVVLWFFWHGRGWARALVQITSVVALLNLLTLGAGSVLQSALIIAEAALGAYLLFWLHREPARTYFAATSAANVQ